MDSLSYLQEKLSHLQQKYPHRSRYCALRMVITSIHALFKCYRTQIKAYQSSKNPSNDQVPCIIFVIKGGLGDMLIASNYIFSFYKYVSAEKPIKIKIQNPSMPLLQAFCKNLPGVVEIGTQLNSLKGNLQVELMRFPRILEGDRNALAKYSPRLKKLLEAWNNFYIHNRKFFDFMPQIDGLSNDYSAILGNKRINQADIGGLLNMPFEYQAILPTTQNFTSVLQKFQLHSPFITIQRGQGMCDTKSTNNKLWPVTYYNQLIGLLRRQYPQCQFIQLGTNREGYNEDFADIDVNLRGKTNLEELKVILKHAALHIDCEGGLVHLRHALKGGPSVVLFGPTSPDVYGYKENLNLRSTACPHPCEWITNDWLSRCARRTNKHICMESLTPQFVFEEIKKWTLI